MTITFTSIFLQNSKTNSYSYCYRATTKNFTSSSTMFTTKILQILFLWEKYYHDWTASFSSISQRLLSQGNSFITCTSYTKELLLYWTEIYSTKLLVYLKSHFLGIFNFYLVQVVSIIMLLLEILVIIQNNKHGVWHFKPKHFKKYVISSQ